MIHRRRAWFGEAHTLGVFQQRRRRRWKTCILRVLAIVEILHNIRWYAEDRRYTYMHPPIQPFCSILVPVRSGNEIGIGAVGSICQRFPLYA